MTVKLSDTAKSVLISAGTSRQGAKTYPLENHHVRAELVRHGLIGPDDGLTMRGTIVRERLVDAILAPFDW